jgi:hypothetical protein
MTARPVRVWYFSSVTAAITARVTGYSEAGDQPNLNFRIADHSGVIQPSGAIWDRMFLRQTNFFFYQRRRKYAIKGARRPLNSNVKAAFLGL